VDYYPLSTMDICSHYNPYQRMREAQSKIAPAMDSAIPPSEREKMYYIDGIGTDPAHQGHGFGSMLLQTITEQVSVIQITQSLTMNFCYINLVFNMTRPMKSLARVGLRQATSPTTPSTTLTDFSLL
jgi:GNAT superfamily N-acetyltransferase